MNDKISVSITSHNGMKFIAEQLDSIRTQTLPPDEVVIADNCSTDGTFEFCRDYIAKHNLTGWKIYQNEYDTGLVKNCRTVLDHLTGDILFTCDQDDIWMPDKVASMVSVMKAHPEIKLLASNYVPLVLGKIGKSHLKYINRNDGSVLQLKFSNTGMATMRPGCVFCFRSELMKKFAVLYNEELLYDSWLWKYAILSDSLYLLNRQLIYYRRHEGVATGTYVATTPINLDARINSSDKAIEISRMFLDASEGLEMTPANREILRKHIDFIGRRKNVLAKRSSFHTALFVLMNMKHYPTLRNALSDIYAVMFLK